MFFTQKKLLFVKSETTYGIDAVPTAALNAILALNLTIEPLVQTEIERKQVQQGWGAFASIVAGQHVTFSFDIELAGSGTAGLAPAWGPLMLACGMSETVVAATSVQYKTISTTSGSITAYINRDGILHQITGSRGDVSLKYTANGEAMLHFAFTGLFGQPVAAAAVTPDFSLFNKPLSVGKLHTPVFTLDGIAHPMSACEIKHNNVVNYRNLVNYEAVDVMGRAITATASIEEPALTTYDFFALSQSKLTIPMQIVHGVTVGNIITVDAPQCEIAQPKLADMNGVAGMDLTMKLLPVAAGDGDISYTLT